MQASFFFCPAPLHRPCRYGMNQPGALHRNFQIHMTKGRNVHTIKFLCSFQDCRILEYFNRNIIYYHSCHLVLLILKHQKTDVNSVLSDFNRGEFTFLITQTALDAFGLIDLVWLFDFPRYTALWTVTGTCCASDTFIL